MPRRIPFLRQEIRPDPWMLVDPSFPRSHARWGKRQAAHKRPFGPPISYQLFVLKYMCFILTVDLDGGWGSFGGLPPNGANGRPSLSIDATERGSSAITYGRSVRSAIETHPRQRTSYEQRDNGKMLTEEHNRTEKSAWRVMTELTSERRTDQPVRKSILNAEPSRRRGKGKGIWGCQKGKGKNNYRQPTRNAQQIPKGKGEKRAWGSNSWKSNGRPN